MDAFEVCASKILLAETHEGFEAHERFWFLNLRLQPKVVDSESEKQEKNPVWEGTPLRSSLS